MVHAPMSSSAPILRQLQAIADHSRLTALGLASQRLSGGKPVLLDADRSFHAASTFKVCVMMDTYRQARLGRLGLDDLLPVANEFRSIADGSNFALEPADDDDPELYLLVGERMTRRELVRRMIQVSSNLATNILMQDLDAAQVTAFMQQLGGAGVVVRRGVEDKQAYRMGLNNTVTARGLMRVLTALGNREVVSPADSDEMIGVLLGQRFNEMIPAGLPPGARLAHKTGWVADYHHDAAIAYPARGEPFVLSILTQGYPESEAGAAHELVASLAAAIYEFWDRE